MMPMQAGDVNQTWANVERLKTDYNYKPSTGIENGIEAFLARDKSYYYKT
jgi:UDP-glucuronate 4-epimerase